MISFPTFLELEAKRDEVNGRFHRETEPLLIERFQQFGFKPQSENDKNYMILTEKSTNNNYLLELKPYEIIVEFEHVKTGERIKICEITNFALSAHTIMNIVIASVDSWLQYSVVYDYVNAQQH